MKIRAKITLSFITLTLIPVLAMGASALIYYVAVLPMLPPASRESYGAQKALLQMPLIMLIVFMISIVIMIIVLTRMLSTGIIKPLNDLAGAVERMGNGDLDQKISCERCDEFSKLFSELDKMRLRLKYSLERQSKYERSRRELIASITHDLKTPLTSINGYIEALQDGIAEDDETRERYLSVIHSKAMRLNRLIDDLFTFSKLELDELKIELSDHSAANLFEKISCAYELEGPGQGVEIFVKRPLPNAVVRVDEERISQITDNLMDNAMKYARSKIYVSARYTETSHLSVDGGDEISSGWYELRIEDDGEGVSGSDIPKIFDLFYKADKSRNDHKGGSGIGLSICRQLCEAHGGSISVSSPPGKGAAFTVRLPATLRA